MKSFYEEPEVRVVSFRFEDILTSSGLGQGDGVDDTLDDGDD